MQKAQLIKTLRRGLRIGTRKASQPKATQTEPTDAKTSGFFQPPNRNAPSLPTCSYPDVNATVLGSIVPSFHNFTTFSSDVLKLYRSFWRLVYRLPVDDQEAAMVKLRTRFRQARHVKGHKHILQILKNARAEFEHWKGLIESSEVQRARPIETVRRVKPVVQPKKIHWDDLREVRYDPQTKVFALAELSASTLPVLASSSPTQLACATGDPSRVSTKVREFYLERAKGSKSSAVGFPNTLAASSASLVQNESHALSLAEPSEHIWEDLKTVTNNTIPFVRAVGSIGYWENPVIKPKRENLRRNRQYGWNIINKRTAKGTNAFNN